MTNHHYLPELEEELLSRIMLAESPERADIIQAFDILTIDCFTHEYRKQIFSILQDCYRKEKSLAMCSISEEVMQTSKGAFEYLLSMKESPSTAAIVDWSNKLKEKALLRSIYFRACGLAEEIKGANESDEARELLSSITNFLDDDSSTEKNCYSYFEAAEEARVLREQNRTHLSTGFYDLDEVLEGGFHYKTLVSIGAPPSTGKTHFALTLCWNIQNFNPGTSAVLFSMEMQPYRISDRLDSILLNKPLNKITEADRYDLINKQKSSKLHIFDKSKVSIDYMRAKCRLIARKSPISCVMVDHIDLCDKPKSRDLRSDEKLTEIAKGLHDLAKEFNCVVLLLTQLNKEALKKESHRPSMNDAKNSNATAEVSDYWIGLKRIAQWDEGKRYDDSHLFEVIIDKNRHGNQGIIYLTCDNPAYGEINQELARELVSRASQERKPKFTNTFEL